MVEIKSRALRSTLKIAIPFAVIPALALLGMLLPREKSHIFLSLIIAMLSLFLFYAGFEKRTTGSRRAVIVAVMIALSVAGRLIPFFKPVTALTVIAAIYLGSEAGFLVGSLSALISNFAFGQGPWTPFQMLAWGLIGLFAGFMAKPLQKSRLLLLIYGVVSGIAFSLVMDIWNVLWISGGQFSLSLYKTAIIAAIPQTLLYSVSNLIFLFFTAKPLGEKLLRIKTKYGV